MKRMHHPLRVVSRLALIFPLAVLALGMKAENPGDPKAQIEKLEHTMASALERNDSQGFSQYLSSDWKMVDDTGAVKTRKDIVETLNSGGLQFERYNLSNLEIRVYGDSAAVVIGSDAAQGSFNGERFNTQDRFTDVFAKIGGLWQLVSTHISQMEVPR